MAYPLRLALALVCSLPALACQRLPDDELPGGNDDDDDDDEGTEAGDGEDTFSDGSDGANDDGPTTEIDCDPVAQTGCPRGDGWGGPGYAIPDEVSSLPFDEGAVGMARAAPDTGGSQWFVTTSDQPHLVGEYTRFGEVVEGMYVVRRLEVGSTLLGVEIERVGEEPAR